MVSRRGDDDGDPGRSPFSSSGSQHPDALRSPLGSPTSAAPRYTYTRSHVCPGDACTGGSLRARIRLRGGSSFVDRPSPLVNYAESASTPRTSLDLKCTRRVLSLPLAQRYLPLFGYSANLPFRMQRSLWRIIVGSCGDCSRWSSVALQESSLDVSFLFRNARDAADYGTA